MDGYKGKMPQFDEPIYPVFLIAVDLGLAGALILIGLIRIIVTNYRSAPGRGR